MVSAESRRIRASFGGGDDGPEVPIAEQRRQWDEAAAQAELPAGIASTRVEAGGVPAEWVALAGAAERRALLFFHGGGFTTGSCVTHRGLAAHLHLASGAPVLLLDYRLAPEHPFPAAVEDGAVAYEWLLAQGWRPDRLAVGGDSAGAALALATLLRLRERGVRLPAAAVLLSPWVDLALTGASLETHAAVDPLVSRAGLASAASYYLAGADPTDPLASPLYADLRGLPPLLIQTGGDEVLLDDAARLAARASDAGTAARLEIWDEMWHVWHGWADACPEARDAIERVGAFLRERWAADGG
jgi:epsilon-lactone hydrolase